ncbi:MAG TPA: ABC transporter permease [Chloroflexota bacterium]|nr:ABC transporter permease [Chloroflexota bacterium]
MVMRYLGRRLLQIVPVLVGISLVVFLLVRLIPGDPARAMLGTRATPELIARLHSQFGLDKPIWVQYLDFLGSVLHGDFGISFFYQTSIGGLVLARIPLTVALLAYAALMSIILALPLALLAAFRRGGVLDQGIRLLFTGSLGLPAFWLGLLLALILGVNLGLFPVSGAGSGVLDGLWHLTLPAFTIALSITPIIGRSLRSSLIDVLRSDFVTTGRAAGLSRRTITLTYVLRNSLVPAVTVLSVNVGWLIGGTVIVEQVFALPGLGSLLVTSITTRDYTIIQAVTLILALFVVLVNLATDLVYVALDPRVVLR